MSRRRAVCGQSTADGTPCQNGRGCTVNHQAVPGGPASAMTVAAAGAGPDPLTVGGAAVASAKGLDDVLAKLTEEAGEGLTVSQLAQTVGFLFEPVAVEWLRRVDPATPLGTFTDPARTKYRHMAPAGPRTSASTPSPRWTTGPSPPSKSKPAPPTSPRTEPPWV